ncbi:MAG TPA: zinc ribbon domain-containing protein [Steroidobacteraceae bacterium]|jgi:putative FmdB family regulatory protein
MPFYEYECANCKFYKEVMQKVSDAPLKKCPSCGKNALKKLVSAPVFRLKGAGWYETDFKSDKEHKRNLAEKEPEPEKKKEAADSKDVTAEAKPGEKAAEKTADAKTKDAKAADSKSAAETKPAAESAGARRSTRNVRKSAVKAATKSRSKGKSAGRKRR